MIHFFFFSLILANFNIIFNHHNPPFCITIQPKWMCERNKTCTNNASSSSSWLSQLITTVLHPPLPFSLLSYTSLLSLYLDWKPGPRCKGDSTLQLWCRAWSVWLSSGLLSQKDSFLEQCLVVYLFYYKLCAALPCVYHSQGSGGYSLRSRLK